MKAYLKHIDGANLLPATADHQRRLLELLVLEATLQEVDDELTFRPAAVVIPLRAALRLIESTERR